MSLIVDAVGPQVLVQDLGRHGYASLAITTSGAMDRTSLALANRILGNPNDAAGLEVLMGGLAVRATQTVTVTVTGAPVAITAGGIPRPMNAPILLHPDDTLTLGAPTQGLRSYLGVRGGVDVPPVLGSRASDPTTLVGPAAVQVGDELPVGVTPAQPAAAVDLTGVALQTDQLTLTGTWGPRADWFSADARRAFTSQPWQVSAEANRVGIRLTGGALDRAITDELPSEGLVRGAVQVPANGQPLVFSSDHPTTGGYPVIAVIDPASVDVLAQTRPGATVRFQLRELAALG